MSLLTGALPWIQIVLSIVLILSILLQQSSAGLGGALGGSDSGGGIHHTRRGFEKFLFYVSIVTAVLFAVFALAAFLL